MNANKMVPAILTFAGLVACGKSSSKSDAAANNTGTTRTPSGTVQAASVDELGLTGALNINLPPALSEGTSLRLAEDQKKSMEACLMRESAKQLVTQIKMISSTLCHIEAEGKNIPWNTPVILDVGDMAAGPALQGGPGDTFDPNTVDPNTIDPNTIDPSTTGDKTGDTTTPPSFTIPKIGIYTDDSDGNNIAVYICEGETTTDMKLSQAFKITGSKTITKDGKSVKVSKGTIHISSGDDTMGTFKGAIGFDSNYTEADASAMKLEVKFGFSGFSFAQKFEIGANDSGFSKVSISESGTMDFGVGDPFSFKNAGIGVFDAINGNVLYNYEGNGRQFATQACVDANSYLTDCTATKFAEGGTLHLKSTDVPGVLAAAFSPTAPSGFDCATADWSKTIKPATDSATNAKHDACNEGMMDQAAASMSGMSKCFSDTGYAKSEQPADIEFSEVQPGDFEPELPELPAE
ncbi:MAG TPA: hypothetical protein VFO10_27870 [Oligoflexus sp.]|uniref:hypothetical protein n=1 Tax=Oligoflexus sp. TaxID=1971216 RepID=UPI002D7E9DC5|nr:hypothetical protein [Oligoflexus sp.]HET9241115.1 hypothetical protein [Oligoflexus sp.]